MLAVHASFLALAVLCWLMGTASLIDADEQTIPDAITLPGTLIGLLFAASYPWSLLPDGVWMGNGPPGELDFLRLTSPNGWPAVLGTWQGLAIGLACFVAWCLAVMPLRWHGRHGWRRALGLVLARVLRDPVLWVGIAGSVGIAAVWQFAPAAHWAGLLSALVGLAVGGGVIWLVRIIGSRLLGQEAMGFGDVTLMAMIGTFVGWQGCLIVFFLAPLAGAVIAILRLVLRRQRDIAYGPFLCLGTLLLLVGWAPIWSVASAYFSIGWLVPALMAICMVMLAVLLGTWIFIRDRLLNRGED